MTDTTTNKLINQLRALVLLTQTEEQVARTRISQARTDAVRRELTQNADNAAARSLEITEALRSIGGVPDVVTPAIGRLSSILKATFEQASPIEEALLTDLQLEHQLLDRATYVKVLADRADEPKVRRLAEKLITAHEATVEWLTVVLAEEAMGGPAALVATPVQKVAGGVAPRRVAHRRARGGGRGRPRRSGRHPGAEGRRRRGPCRQRPGPLLGQLGQQRRRHGAARR